MGRSAHTVLTWEVGTVFTLDLSWDRGESQISGRTPHGLGVPLCVVSEEGPCLRWPKG